MKINYRPEIDGLRAIAVMSVILYHAEISLYGERFFKGGFIGVDIFFVISGYLISSIIIKELIAKGSFSFLYFYERRIRRILPVLIFVIIFSLPLAWYCLLSHRFVNFSESIISSIFFGSNFYFHYSGLRYGAVDGLFKPFLHTWSLSIEEQFYILFPVVFVFIFYFLRKYVLHFLLLGFFISLVFAEWASITHYNFNFYMLPSRGWELLSGAIIAYLHLKYKFTFDKRKIWDVFCLIGIFLILYSVLFLFEDGMRHPSFLTLIPIIGTCLIIFFSNKNSIITNLLSNKIFVGIGLVSYSLYLWHYPVFVFSRIDDNKFFNFNKIELLVIVFILSFISYFLVEKPARNKKIISFKKLLSLVLFVITSIVIFSFTIIKQDGFPDRFHDQLNIQKFRQDHADFEKGHDYDNFSNKQNILIIGNSVAEDLQRMLYFSEKINEKYYSYVFSPKERPWTKNYQLECFKDFLLKKITRCRRVEFTKHIQKQYDMADFIVFASHTTELDILLEVIEYIKKDNKKYVVYINDFFIEYKNYLNRFDTYVYKNGNLPIGSELNKLERNVFTDSIDYENKNNLRSIKKKLSENKINFVSRRDIFCNKNKSKCELITDNFKKIYRDHIHFTEDGSKYLSDQLMVLLKYFED